MQLCNAAGYTGPHPKILLYTKNKPPKVVNCSASLAMVGRILPFDVTKQRGLLLQVHAVTVADSGGKYTRRLETGVVTELFASASEIAGRVFSHLEAPRPLGKGPAFFPRECTALRLYGFTLG